MCFAKSNRADRSARLPKNLSAHDQAVTATAARWHGVSKGPRTLMNTQNIAQALCAITLIAALSTPAFAQDAASRSRVSDSATPTSATPAVSTNAGMSSTPSASDAALTPSTPAASTTGAILPAPDRTSTAAGTISGSLDVSHAVSTIEGVESNDREKLLGEISGRENAVDQQVSSLKNKASDVKPDIRDAISSAWNDYQKAKSQLDQSIAKSRSTTGPAWERFRSELAADYAFFASSVAGLEVALPN